MCSCCYAWIKAADWYVVKVSDTRPFRHWRATMLIEKQLLANTPYFCSHAL
jgi:hypothetical protein